MRHHDVTFELCWGATHGWRVILHRDHRWGLAVPLLGGDPILVRCDWSSDRQGLTLSGLGEGVGDVSFAVKWNSDVAVASSGWAARSSSRVFTTVAYKGQLNWEVEDEDGETTEEARELELYVARCGGGPDAYCVERDLNGEARVFAATFTARHLSLNYREEEGHAVQLRFTDPDLRRLRGTVQGDDGVVRGAYLLLVKPSNLYDGRRSALETCDRDGVIKLLSSDEVRNVMFMLGAGISVAAGIPDYRTPGTGLYYTLDKYNLPTPESVFTMSYLRENPAVFFAVERELPDLKKLLPTDAHRLLKAISDKKKLLRVYTQNVDGFERRAGVPVNELVECHGSGYSAHCIDCKAEMPLDVYERIVHVDKDIPRCASCGSVCVADFVLYGEPLPDRFFELREKDAPRCDLLIIMGTSLKVMPFARLVNQVPDDCPRVLINNEAVGMDLGMHYEDDPTFTRDVHLKGDLQEHCRIIMEALQKAAPR